MSNFKIFLLAVKSFTEGVVFLILCDSAKIYMKLFGRSPYRIYKCMIRLVKDAENTCKTIWNETRAFSWYKDYAAARELHEDLQTFYEYLMTDSI